MEPAERPRGKKADRERPKRERAHLREVPYIERADLSNEQIADDEVEESPEHVHGRGRQSPPRRICEGRLERPPRHAADEVRNCVGEHRAAEEIRNEMKPGHWTIPVGLRILVP